MTEQERIKLKGKILSEIDGLAQDIQLRKESAQAVEPDDAIGRLTRMEAINSKSVNEATLKQLKVKLSSLKSALDRIDSEDYGYCVECEEEISIKRLNILPGALKCVRCAG